MRQPRILLGSHCIPLFSLAQYGHQTLAFSTGLRKGWYHYKEAHFSSLPPSDWPVMDCVGHFIEVEAAIVVRRLPEHYAGALRYHCYLLTPILPITSTTAQQHC